MRSLLLLSAIIAITACSDNQQPTSPVNGAVAHTPSTNQLNQLPEANGKPVPGPVPFTKMATYYGPGLVIPAGNTNTTTVQCPAGSVPTGGGYDVSTSGGTYPIVYYNHPTATGWIAGANNQQAGSAEITIRAWVLCAS